MKNSRNERLSEHLMNVDEEIFANAYEIDDAEKLKKYIRTKNAKTKKPFYITPAFRRVAATAACFVLIIGVIFSIPALFNKGGDAPNKDPDNDRNHLEEVTPPWLKGEEDYLTINSIDMLNYYTAMKVLADPTNVTNTASYKTDSGITLLSASVNASANSYGFTLLSNTDSDVGYDTPPEGYNPNNQEKNEEKVYYYELDPNEVFSVSRVIFFQIEIKNANGFLASKVGTGIIDVVITENSLEPMITFRNGDRYYSCCENSLLDNGKLYSTHKYIEGFYIVKNLEQENYSFSVEYDNFNLDYVNVIAKSVTCDSYKNGGNIPDGEMSVISKTYFSNHSVEMTIADLEEYFNTGKFPDGTEDSSQTENPPVVTPPAETVDFYTNGQYVFALQSDNTFVYYSIDENSAVYRKGSYSWGCDAIEFRFMYEGEVVETISCDLAGPISFIYNGSEYAKEPTGGEPSPGDDTNIPSDNNDLTQPKNTTLEFWITEDVKDQDWTGYDEIYGWMGAREFLGRGYKKTQDGDGCDQPPKYYVSYVITAWPDYADGGQFVTDITVTDPVVKVYGLTIASTFEEFDAVFESLGYELSWGEGAIKTRVATRDGITFRLTRAVEDNPDVVPQIRISAEVTNREGIVF